MKATHYFKGTGQPCGHVQVKFTVTGDIIAKELWYQVTEGLINAEIVHILKPPQITKLIRTRFQDYGYYAYEREEFEAFDELPSFKKYQHLREAKDKFPDFFEGIDLNDLTA
jgi:hypothetical protein